MIKMVSLILGGGVGSRLYPLTANRSKPAVPIGGKYRLIDIPISNCLNSGVKRMFVLTQFNSASLNQHIKNTYHFDIFNPGFVDILAAEQTHGNSGWYQGTADAVRQSMHHLDNHDFDYVLILSGDQLYQMDFYEMIIAHIEKKAEISIATIPVDADDATGFGIMKVNKDGMIDKFIEKPSKEKLADWSSPVSADFKKKGKVYLASMGIYIFNRSTLKSLFTNYPEATDFGKGIIPAAIQSGLRTASYKYNGYWTDIGSIKSFYEANIALTKHLPEFNLFDNVKQIYTRPRLLPPSKIFGTKFNQSILADGCIVHAKFVNNSIVGIRSRIGEKSSLDHVIMMGSDYYETLEQIVNSKDIPPIGIGKNSKISNAILDKNCRVGNNVVIEGGDHLANTEEKSYCIVDGIVVVKKNAVIADGTVIGAKK
jgi:glucose-1-phosphate adenylyltransferase